MIVTTENFNSTINSLTKRDLLFVDLETTGLEPFLGDKICGIAVLAGDESFYYPFRHIVGDNLPLDYLGKLAPYLSDPSKTYVGHNYKFDLKFLHREGVPLPAKILDTLIAAHLLDEDSKNLKLKSLGAKFFGKAAAEAESVLEDKLNLFGYGKGDMYRLPATDVAPYAEQDVILTAKLLKRFEGMLKQENTYELFKEVSEFELLITQMELYGIKLDVDKVKSNLAEATSQINKVGFKIRDMRGYAINPGSPIQVQKWLGIADSTSRTLERLNRDEARAVLEYRAWSKVKNTYYSPFLQRMDKDNCIHPTFRMTGTVSGRLSCSKPNLHAVPRKSEIYKVKDCIIAREGYVLAEIDYSQAEIRVGSHYARENKMLDMIRAGVDIHTATAKEVGIDRFIAKTLNFSIIYGIGATALAENLNISEADARKYLNKYNKQFPGFRKLLYDAQNVAKNRGYITMYSGRRRHFTGYEPPYHKAISYLVQGSASEMLRSSMCRIWNEMDRDVVRMVLTVHDSILFEIKKGYQDEVIPEILRIMNDQPWCSSPIKSDADVGESWGTMKAY